MPECAEGLVREIQVYMAEEWSDTDTEDEMMSVTLTPDTDMVNRVNSAPQEPYRRQIFAKMIVGDCPVRFQLYWCHV